MEDEKITCANCGRDLSITGNCIDFRLALNAEEIPERTNCFTLLSKCPQLNKTVYLCDIKCLKSWSKEMDFRS